jgi:hypothetical protein
MEKSDEEVTLKYRLQKLFKNFKFLQNPKSFLTAFFIHQFNFKKHLAYHSPPTQRPVLLSSIPIAIQHSGKK